MENAKIVTRKNWIKRTVAGTCLIAYLILTTYIGIPALFLTTFFIQIKSFEEIMSVAYNHKKLPPEIPLFRTLNWYFVVVANYFFFAESFGQHLEVFDSLRIIFKYHRFVSFCCYIIGLIWFLNLLRSKVIRQQFGLLAWVHFLCIIIVCQSYMVVQNFFEAIIWVFVPVSLVSLNDIFAYIFGRLYGKTPLIEVSPRKTLEGFLGGAIGSVVAGSLVGYILCHFDYFVCPSRFISLDDSIKMTTECTRSYIFQPLFHSVSSLTIKLYPFLYHNLILALFASFIAPFGGFCASGFKRAFNAKNFGDFIPGHGGIMDRFDCHYLMATFVNVYVSSFVKSFTVDKMYAKVLSLSEDNQLVFYRLLEGSLKGEGLINS